jgi:triosephosphate isomerase
MRRPLIAGNWKMYKTVREAVDFVQALKPMVSAATECDVVVAPPFTAIKAVADRLEGSGIRVSSQNVASEVGPGAFTGEVSAAMLREAGAALAIVGHSERRAYFGETDQTVNKKIFCCLNGLTGFSGQIPVLVPGEDVGLEPIVCVGEVLSERDAGRAQEVVESQLSAGLANLTLLQASRIIIAYEPVWAIGTGRTATPEIAQEMHAFIRSRIKKMFGESVAEGIRVLYGGSVKPDNISALMDCPDIDGALVGGASLEAESFAGIVNFKKSR